ncbi:MAG: fumarate hydratase [Candidatus Goldbacteria bacterium]|nr:fumarate hydratase [Candidatus Goldiibacteriota bacterium]
MRIIQEKQIIDTVAKLAIDANYYLPYDVVAVIKEFAKKERNKKAKNGLFKIIENYKKAKKGIYPLCQDTGIAVVFVEIGNNVCINGDIYRAINKGIEIGYEKGYLRKSTTEPLKRKNFGTNTPAIIHLEVVPGSKIKISLMTKGAGAENKSNIKMFTPTEDIEEIIQFVIDTVKNAGASACPPYIIGVGIGGNFETAPLLAKKALLRNIKDFNKNKEIANLEKLLLKRINELKIGAFGFGGDTTAIAVKVETMPCHIASLPVAVNIQCHSARHKTIII